MLGRARPSSANLGPESAKLGHNPTRVGPEPVSTWAKWRRIDQIAPEVSQLGAEISHCRPQLCEGERRGLRGLQAADACRLMCGGPRAASGTVYADRVRGVGCLGIVLTPGLPGAAFAPWPPWPSSAPCLVGRPSPAMASAILLSTGSAPKLLPNPALGGLSGPQLRPGPAASAWLPLAESTAAWIARPVLAKATCHLAARARQARPPASTMCSGRRSGR